MMKMKKILALLVVMMMTFTAAAGCGDANGGKEGMENIPSYVNEKADYLTWAYYSLSNNQFTVDGETTVLEGGKRLPTREEMQQYKGAGFNVVFINWMFGYDARTSDFKNSDMKRLMDIAYEIGLKCLVVENHTYNLSTSETSLIVDTGADGENTFDSQDALNAYFLDLLDEIVAHPAFYGFSLKDEPSYKLFPAISEVRKGILSVAPKAYVNTNLLPLQNSSIKSNYCKDAGTKTYQEAYREYLTQFYNLCQPDHIQYDDYPLLINDRDEKSINEWHLLGAQIVADFCREKKIKFYKVFQGCAYATDRGAHCRKPSLADMYWQNNIGAAMGVKGFSYWTYYPVANAYHEYYDETATFVKRDGTANDTYRFAKQIHEELFFTGRALSKFTYSKLNYYIKTPVPGDIRFLSGVKKENLASIQSVELEDAGILLVTELRDGDTKGFYFVNATDPSLVQPQSVIVEFNDFDCVQIYAGGKKENKRLTNGKIILSLEPGRGAFLIPFHG